MKTEEIEETETEAEAKQKQSPSSLAKKLPRMCALQRIQTWEEEKMMRNAKDLNQEGEKESRISQEMLGLGGLLSSLLFPVSFATS